MNNIKYFREQAKLSQTQFSILCGWGKQQARISHYETGRRTPSPTSIHTMISVLNDKGQDCSFGCLFPNPAEQDNPSAQV